MRWNEVTWYSRLGTIIVFLGVLPILCFYTGMQYGLLEGAKIVEIPVIYIKHSDNFTPEATTIVESTQKTSQYTPLKVNPNLVYNSSGKSKSHPSPDGNYTAISYSNEGGESAIYIVDGNEQIVTDAFCGFFNEWSSDSARIKVLVPVECNSPVDYSYFYLTVNGNTIPINE